MSISGKKANVLESKILTLERDHNLLDQYRWRNNIKITGIPDTVSDQNLKGKVEDILNKISVDVSPKDIEACHCVGLSKNSLKKTVVHFIKSMWRKLLEAGKKLRNNSSLIAIFLLMKISLWKTVKSLFLEENLQTMVMLIKSIQKTENGAYF